MPGVGNVLRDRMYLCQSRANDPFINITADQNTKSRVHLPLPYGFHERRLGTLGPECKSVPGVSGTRNWIDNKHCKEREDDIEAQVTEANVRVPRTYHTIAIPVKEQNMLLEGRLRPGVSCCIAYDHKGLHVHT